MIFFICLIVFGYLVLGTRAGMNDVARQQALIKPRPPKPDVLTRRHGAGCNLNYSSLKYQGCDCRYRSEWAKAKDEQRAYDKSGYREQARVNYLLIALWPLFMYHNLVLNTPTKESKVERQRRIEIENAKHIAEMSSILSSNEQKIRSSLDIGDRPALPERPEPLPNPVFTKG